MYGCISLFFLKHIYNITSIIYNVYKIYLCLCMCVKSLQSCPTLCDPMDCSHQAPMSMGSPGKNTGVVAMPSSRGSSRPRDWSCFSCGSCISRQRGSLPLAPPGKPLASSEWEIGAHFCPTLCDPMDCGLPCSSVHGVLQARILEWVTISFSKGSSEPRDRTWVSCIAGRHFTVWTTREAQEYWSG